MKMPLKILEPEKEHFPKLTQLSILDTNNSEHIREFEEAFFESFVNIENRLIHKIWDWDFREKRLKTRIPYHHQIIYALRDEKNSLIAIIATNLDHLRNQFTEFGFSVPDNQENFCEVLALFIRPSCHLSLFQLSNFVSLCVTDASSRGFTHMYATCGKTLLNLYKRLGCQLLETQVIDEEIRHFILLDF